MIIWFWWLHLWYIISAIFIPWHNLLKFYLSESYTSLDNSQLYICCHINIWIDGLLLYRLISKQKRWNPYDALFLRRPLCYLFVIYFWLQHLMALNTLRSGQNPNENWRAYDILATCILLLLLFKKQQIMNKRKKYNSDTTTL